MRMNEFYADWGLSEDKASVQIKGSLIICVALQQNARALNIHNPGCESQVFNGIGVWFETVAQNFFSLLK